MQEARDVEVGRVQGRACYLVPSFYAALRTSDDRVGLGVARMVLKADSSVPFTLRVHVVPPQSLQRRQDAVESKESAGEPDSFSVVGSINCSERRASAGRLWSTTPPTLFYCQVHCTANFPWPVVATLADWIKGPQDVDRFLQGTRAGKRDPAVVLDAVAVGIHVVDQLPAAGNLVGGVGATRSSKRIRS